jgi:tryptophan-rich sensory protein
MSPWRIICVAIAIAVLLIYIGGANYWNRPDGWYQSLVKPSWQPPGYIFGIIWPYNFVVLGIALYQIASRGKPWLVISTILIFALSVFAALRWSYLFYSAHDLAGAATALKFTAILTIPILASTFSVSLRAGLALLPYQIWIFIAALLSASYAAKN